jgi:hypothetical protein
MRVRDTRCLVETDLRDLQKLLNRNSKTARAELANHISKITLTPREAIYVGVGDWHLCISWAWSLTIVPEQGIGPNVCLVASSGRRQLDPYGRGPYEESSFCWAYQRSRVFLTRKHRLERGKSQGSKTTIDQALIDVNVPGYQLPKAGTKVSQIAPGVEGFE